MTELELFRSSGRPSSLATNLARVRETIATTAIGAGREPQQIRLIAVSKTHPAEALEVLHTAGQHAFGENTVQEALPKIARLAARTRSASVTVKTPEWHFIGHLQSNKTKFIPGNFAWVHSLDSVKLAQRLSRAACERRAVINTLIEVNVTGDSRKHGIAPPELLPLLERLHQNELPGIALRGLMTIGPYPAAEAEIRRAYAALRGLRDSGIERLGLTNFNELSMGMSGDYVAAIKEGATMLRIGTAIFGERDYG